MKKILLLLTLAVASLSAQATKNYALIDVDRNEVIESQGEGDVVPMASITKLMTVLVVINSGRDLSEKVTVTGRERSTKIRSGEIMTRQDLINLTLITSDNLAARTLAETTFSSYSWFIAQMNNTAAELGMVNTRFVEPTGLSVFNVSTPWEIYLMTKETSRHAVFNQAAGSRVVEVYTSVKNRIKRIFGTNTNSWAGFLNIQSAKTGFTSHAGRCLTMLIEQDGRRYAVIVMGARNPVERQATVQTLIAEIGRRFF